MRKLVVALSIVCSLVITHPALAASKAQKVSTSSTGNISYTVKAGDTISSISRVYNVTMENVIGVNKLADPSRLKIGQVLVIPQQGNIKKETKPLAVLEDEKTVKYTVKSNDTLSGIAKVYGTTVLAIQSANKLASPDKLTIGQVLEIPLSHRNQSSVSREDNRVHSTIDNTLNSNKVEEIIAYAKGFLGSPYSYGAIGPNSFDCSGFTMFVFNHFGINLPHNSAQQSTKGDLVNRDMLIPGDLVFFNTSQKGISHVGIYIGGGSLIHASTSGRRVEISSLSDDYYNKRYVTARRIL